MENLEPLAAEAREKIAAAGDGQALEQLRVDYLGKKGQITALLKGLGQLDPANASYVLYTLHAAVDACLSGRCHAMVAVSEEVRLSMLEELRADATTAARLVVIPNSVFVDKPVDPDSFVTKVRDLIGE